jgi:hypothetical protein
MTRPDPADDEPGADYDRWPVEEFRETWLDRLLGWLWGWWSVPFRD